MAEFRADHEIVTNFLLNTCRLDPLLNINLIQALCDCAGVDNKCVSTDDDEIHYIFVRVFLDPAQAGFEFPNPARSVSGRTWKSGIRHIPRNMSAFH